MFNSEDLDGARRELGQALSDHDQWHQALIRTLVCRLPHDPRDVAEDADRQCRFAQAYGARSWFAGIDEDHRRMHRLARRLLEAAGNGASISPAEYDAFSGELGRLHARLQALKQEIEIVLYQHDPLTGAERRVGMFSRLREALDLVRARVHTCSVVVMDLDHFKAVNDVYGHLVGDHLLAGAVAHVRDHMRPSDRVFRYGGEEFLILLASIDPAAAVSVVERIRSSLKAEELIEGVAPPVRITASFGVAALDPEAGVEESIDRADKALYAAKAAGRDCVRVWERDIRDRH